MEKLYGLQLTYMVLRQRHTLNLSICFQVTLVHISYTTEFIDCLADRQNFYSDLYEVHHLNT